MSPGELKRWAASPAAFAALRALANRQVVSNTVARSLTKLGWASMRKTPVYEGGVRRWLVSAHLTEAGRALLRASQR